MRFFLSSVATTSFHNLTLFLQINFSLKTDTNYQVL